MNIRILSVVLALLMTVAINFSCSVKPQEPEDFHQWAAMPPMGWNSWDCYGPTVTEDEVKANADYMASNMKQNGWEYIVVDIRWYVANDKAHGYNEKDPVFTLDEYGRFLPSAERFPSAQGDKGFKPLADYVHDKGLKFGIHVMRGIPVEAVKKNTPIKGTNIKASEIYSTELQCRWLRDMYTVVATKPGAQEYYNSLIELYASWGVDYIKVDDLSIPYHTGEIEMLRKAIDNSGREIVLSTSPGETPIDHAEHIKNNANLFRIVGDFWDNWPQVKEHFEVCNRWAPHIGTGHWPDADMLPLGRIGIRAERGDNRMCRLSKDEQTTVMSLFSIFKSPLMFGGDLPSNDAFTLSLLTNEEVLYVNQNSINNRQIFHNNQLIGWMADDPKTGDKFLALFNASDQPHVDETKALWKSEVIQKETPGQQVDVGISLGRAKKVYLVSTQGDQEYVRHDVDWIAPTLHGPKGEIKLTKVKWVNALGSGPHPILNQGISGQPLTIDGKIYQDGIGTYANSIIEFNIPDGYDLFTAKAGIDNGAYKPGVFGQQVRFMVFTEDPTGAIPPDSTQVSASFNQLGIKGKYNVRDLWAKQNLGKFENQFSKVIRRHASGLYRLSKEN